MRKAHVPAILTLAMLFACGGEDSRPPSPCAGEPCANGGTCLVNEGEAYCACAPGFGGARCELRLDDCADAPCRNGATCIDRDGGYLCLCAAGFAGEHCETDVDDCAESPCANGGTCTDRVAGFTCACAEGFTGARCETELDECEAGPCENGARCVDQIAGALCLCPPGFEGERCELEIDECAGAPCANGGVCTDGVASFSCACPDGFEGERCERDVDECAGAPCLNGGLCVNRSPGFECRCEGAHAGPVCADLARLAVELRTVAPVRPFVASRDDGGAYLATSFDERVELPGPLGVETVSGTSAGLIARFDHRGLVSWYDVVDSADFLSIHAVESLPDGAAVAAVLRSDATLGATTARPLALSATSSVVNLVLARYSEAGVPEWALSTHSPRRCVALGGGIVVCLRQAYFDGLAAGPGGVLAATGYFNSQLVFAPGRADERTLAGGDEDAFVVSVNGDGTVAWARGVLATGTAIGHAVSVLDDGSVVAVGRFLGTVTIEGGGAAPAVFTSAPTSEAGWIARWSAEGDLVSAASITGSSSAVPTALACDGDGSCVAAGFSLGNEIVVGEGTPGEHVIASVDGGRFDFVVGLDPDGGVAWSDLIGFGASSYSEGRAVARDAQGRTTVAASLSGTAYVDTRSAEPRVHDAGAGLHLLLVQWDAGGAVLRSTVAEDAADAQPIGVETGPDGSLLLGGTGAPHFGDGAAFAGGAWMVRLGSDFRFGF